MSKQLAILAYHKIGKPSPGNWDTWYYVPSAIFESQMRHLRDGGWRTINVDMFLAALLNPDTLPDQSALITFDDGYLSVLSEAAPVLQRFGFPAIIFVPTDFIGGHSSFDADSPEPVEPICNWSDLCELERAQVSIQSHGVTHRPFSQLSSREIEQELKLSRTILEQKLAKRVSLFSYPYNDAGHDTPFSAAAACRAGYGAAFQFTGGAATIPPASPFHLSRIPVWPDSDLSQLLGLPSRVGSL
jgi:peptidoglycan/xylan/chitin deacetylase (PgdA/CDA1 family)